VGPGLPPAARRAAAHVFVADLGRPELTEADRHHLVRVLRVQDGEVISTADNAGGWRLCRLRGSLLLPDGEVVRVVVPAPPVTVAFAPPKGDRADWAVQKLTELGVDRIVALAADRGVVRWEAERAQRAVRRWRAIAREAAMQARRARIPEVDGPISPAALLDQGWLDGDACAGAGVGGVERAGRVALAEPGGIPPSIEQPTVLVGPEGGWSEREASLPVVRVGLGDTILRTETAAVVAAARLLADRTARAVELFGGA
jgi:16S rRNA (uracil1498-N3)-methyltransferase